MTKRNTVLGMIATALVTAGIAVALLQWNTSPTEAHGPDNENGDHPHNHSGRAYRAGDRCINNYQDQPHEGFSHAAYTQGTGKGTYPVVDVNASTEWINDEIGWEAQISWKAPRYGMEEAGKWACQPHTYIIQRKIGNGSWTDFESSRRNPATVRFSRRHGTYGPHAAFSTDEMENDEPATLTKLQYRVCGRLQGETDTYRNCVESPVIFAGGSTWAPQIYISHDATLDHTASESERTIDVSVSSNPPPPEDFTSNDRRTLPVTINITPTSGAGCPQAPIPSQTQDVLFNTDGDGTFTLDNPKPNDSVFTDACEFTYRVGSGHGGTSLNITEDDRWDISVTSTKSVLDASDNTAQGLYSNVTVSVNGVCPSNEKIRIPILISATGGATADHYHHINHNQSVILGDGNCTKTAAAVVWRPHQLVESTSTYCGAVTIRADAANAVNTLDNQPARANSASEIVVLYDSRFHQEEVSVAFTVIDDDEIGALEFTSFPRPVLVPDSDGQTDETAGYVDDAHARVVIKFPAKGDNPCHIKYIYVSVTGENLVNHGGYRMSDNALNNFPFSVPYGDSLRYWTVEQKTGYREYTLSTWPGQSFKHYDEETTDSEFILLESTAGDAKEGRITSYAAGNRTVCNDEYHDADPPTSAGTNYHSVKFSVE